MSTPTQSKEDSKTDLRVLAIDPGFDRMGVAVLERQAGKEVVLFSMCIQTSAKESRARRLLQIGENLTETIITWHPTALAIETIFFNQNASSVIGVAEARGVALYTGISHNLTIYEYGPQDIKIAVTGYGKASKVDVEKMVEKLVKLPQRSGKKRIDDELDAVAIGLTYFAHEGARRRLSPA